MTQYLISRGWRKMRRRINHWSSLGFLFVLKLEESEIQSAFTTFHDNGLKPSRLRKDQTLAHVFGELSDDEIYLVMNGHPEMVGGGKDAGLTGIYKGLTKLRAAFREILQPESCLETAYTIKTCVEFHQLSTL